MKVHIQNLNVHSFTFCGHESTVSSEGDVDGDEIMEHLDLGPGREVGQALKFLLEIKREEGDIEKEELKRRLNSWWSQRS